MPINMFFVVKNHWEPYFTDNLVFVFSSPKSHSIPTSGLIVSTLCPYLITIKITIKKIHTLMTWNPTSRLFILFSLHQFNFGKFNVLGVQAFILTIVLSEDHYIKQLTFGELGTLDSCHIP
jgi:hypothetical protein